MRKLLFIAAAMAIAIVVGAPGLALAQSVAETYSVDLTPAIQLAGIILISIVGPLLVRWAKRLGDKLGVEIDQELLIYLDDALERSVTLAINRIGPVSIDTRSRLIKEAGEYLVRNSPAVVRRFRLIDRHGVVDWERMEDLMESRDLIRPIAGGAS